MVLILLAYLFVAWLVCMVWLILDPPPKTFKSCDTTYDSRITEFAISRFIASLIWPLGLVGLLVCATAYVIDGIGYALLVFPLRTIGFLDDYK